MREKVGEKEKVREKKIGIEIVLAIDTVSVIEFDTENDIGIDIKLDINLKHESHQA